MHRDRTSISPSDLTKSKLQLKYRSVSKIKNMPGFTELVGLLVMDMNELTQ